MKFSQFMIVTTLKPLAIHIVLPLLFASLKTSCCGKYFNPHNARSLAQLEWHQTLGHVKSASFRQN